MGLKSRYVVVVRVITDCTLGCQFCGFSRDLRIPSRSIDWTVLEKLGRSLQRFQESSNREVLVAWLGGEPFLWRDWRRASRFFKEQLGLGLAITTNGIALKSPAVREDVLRWFSEITVSIDGFAESHDRLRQRPGMFAELGQVVRTLAAEARSNFERDENSLCLRENVGTRPSDFPVLRVNTVLTRDNIESFPKFCREMAKWGFNEITFNQLGGNDRPEFYPENRLLPEQVRRLELVLPSLQREMGNFGVLLKGSEAYLRRMLASSEETKIPVEDCGPGENFLFVDELGRLSPCSFTSNDFTDCRIESNSIDELASKFMQRRDTNRPNACADCLATHVSQKFDSPATSLSNG